MLTAVNDITSRIQLLSASMGAAVNDGQSGPMPLWEVIEGLRLATKRVQGISEGNYIYLDELQLQLPNWGTTLEELSKSYVLNLPKMNASLIGCCSRLDILEARPTGPLADLSGISSGRTHAFDTAGQSYVSQSNFNSTKINLKTNLRNLRNLIGAIGGIEGNNEPRLDKGFCGCPSYTIWITGTEYFWGQMADLLETFLDGVQGATSPSKSYYALVLLQQMCVPSGTSYVLSLIHYTLK